MCTDTLTVHFKANQVEQHLRAQNYVSIQKPFHINLLVGFWYIPEEMNFQRCNSGTIS